MVAKNIIYLLFDGSLKIPDGEKAALWVEPSLAELIRLLSNLQIRPTLSYHKKCIARLLIMHPRHKSLILCFQLINVQIRLDLNLKTL